MSTDVIVVGAGPTGLFLASELTAAGISCRVLESRMNRTKDSRALGINPRTIETLDLRGMSDSFLACGNPIARVRMSLGERLIDLSAADTRFGHLLIIPQSMTELLFEERLNSLGVTVERGLRCRGVRQDGDTVAVRVDDGETEREERARWVVGCDGSRSAVRDSLGISFKGGVYPYTIIVADVRLERPLDDALRIQIGRRGLVVSTDFGSGWYRMGVIDRTKQWSDDPVTIDEVRRTLAGIYGADLGPSEPLWTSRFRIQEHQAGAYRKGHVLLAGDAAHVHSPLGGQGLNLAIQDAMNLGWKLAAVVRGDAGDALLDTYEIERRRIADGVIRATDIATRMMTSPRLVPRTLRRIVVPTVLGNRRTHQHAVDLLTGIAVGYPNTKQDRKDPLGGRRMPDASLTLADRSRTRLYPLLRDASFVLVDRDGTAADAVRPWATRVRHVVAAFEDRPDLASRELVLVRPDGYCAWSGAHDGSAHALERALTRWVGRPDRDPARQMSLTGATKEMAR